MAEALVPGLAALGLMGLTVLRPRPALYVMFAALPLQPLFVPLGGVFWSPADVVVSAGAAAFAVRLWQRGPEAWQALRRHAWLGVMVAGYLAGFAFLGFASRTLARVPLAIVPAVLATELIRERSAMDRAATALVVAALVDIAIGVAFYTGGTWIHPTRFSGVGGPNFSAMIIVVAAVIAFCRVARTMSLARLAVPAPLVLFGFATLSKMGAIALAGVAAIMMPLMTRRNRALVLSAAALILLVALGHGRIREAVLERTQPMAQNDGIARSSIDLRWLLVKAAGRAFVEHPVVGLGFGRFQEYSLTDPDIRSATAGIGFGTHNTFLEILAEGGLLAFVPFLLYFRQFAAGTLQAYRAVMERKDVVLAAVLAGFITVMLCALFGNLLLYYHFWAVCGLALAGLGIHSQEERSAVTPRRAEVA